MVEKFQIFGNFSDGFLDPFIGSEDEFVSDIAKGMKEEVKTWDKNFIDENSLQIVSSIYFLFGFGGEGKSFRFNSDPSQVGTVFAWPINAGLGGELFVYFGSTLPFLMVDFKMGVESQLNIVPPVDLLFGESNVFPFLHTDLVTNLGVMFALFEQIKEKRKMVYMTATSSGQYTYYSITSMTLKKPFKIIEKAGPKAGFKMMNDIDGRQPVHNYPVFMPELGFQYYIFDQGQRSYFVVDGLLGFGTVNNYSTYMLALNLKSHVAAIGIDLYLQTENEIVSFWGLFVLKVFFDLNHWKVTPGQ